MLNNKLKTCLSDKQATVHHSGVLTLILLSSVSDDLNKQTEPLLNNGTQALACMYKPVHSAQNSTSKDEKIHD